MRNINDYKVSFKLGGKGNTKCYLAVKNEKQYCIKTMEVLKSEKKKINKIEIEKEALRRLNNKNIIKMEESFVIDLGETEMHCIVSEVMKMNLAQYLQNNKKPLNEKDCKKIIKQILKAIQFCHLNNICHQDIKLENVLIEGKTKKIKIIDFGMSSIPKDEEEMKSLKEIAGTPYYVSPEKFSFQRYDGRKSDIWSCGVLLFKLASGRFPFDVKNNDLMCLSESICNDTYQMPNVSKDLQSLLSKMLKKDPKKRISISDALSHSWFTKSSQQNHLSKSSNVSLKNSHPSLFSCFKKSSPQEI